MDMFITQSGVDMFVRTHHMVYFKQLKYSVLYFNYNLSKTVKDNLKIRKQEENVNPFL